METEIEPREAHTSHSTHKRKAPIGLMASVLICAVVLLAIGILPRLERSTALAESAKQAKSVVPTVTVIKPESVSDEGVTLPGTIQAIKDAPVNARTTGYIKRLYVDIGSRVKAGQVLADVESPDVDQQAFQAQAQTAQSRATVGQSQATVTQQRANVIQMQAQVSQQSANVEQAKAAVSGTQAKVVQAQAAEGQAKAQLAHAQQALEVQKSNLTQFKAQLDLAKTTNARYQSLAKQGFVAQQDADEKAAAEKTATASVESAQSSIQAAQADVQAAHQAVLSASAVVSSAQADVQASQKSVQAVEASLASSKATVKAAQANVQASLKNVEANQAAVDSNIANARRFDVMRGFEKVTAPFDGVVTSRNVDVGALISAGQSISGGTNSAQTGMFGLARTDEVRIQINVPQTYVPSIKTGGTAQVTVREAPGRVFSGTVTLRAGALDAASRTQLVEVHLPNRDNTLVPGMYAEVHLTPAAPPKSLRVPGTALIIDSQGTRVAVVSPDNTVHLQPIEIGRDFGDAVEITSGLEGTEKLINNPVDNLKDGDIVKVVAAPKNPKKKKK